MATWKKIITSGSNAELNQITASSGISVASIADVTSLTAGGNLDIGAHGFRANTLTADAQTEGNVAIYGANGLLSEDSDLTFSGDTLTATKIGAFQAAGAINFDGQNMTNVDIDSGTIDATDITVGTGKTLDVSGGTLTLANDQISGDKIDGGTIGSTTITTLTSTDITATGTISGSTISGSFVGDGSGLTGTGFNIDELSNSLVSGSIAVGDLFAVADINDSNEEKKITFKDVRDAIFEDVSGDATIAAGGALTIGANTVEGSMLNSNTAGDGLSYGSNQLSVDLSGITNQTIGDGSGTTTIGNNLVVNNDLTVNGDLTTIATTNTLVEDQLMFLGTGSAGTNKDVGIIAQSGSTDKQGSAFYQDKDSQRWSVAKGVNNNATSITPLQFVTTVKTDTVNPDTTSGSYGAGEMHVNTSTGEIWIRFG